MDMESVRRSFAVSQDADPMDAAPAETTWSIEVELDHRGVGPNDVEDLTEFLLGRDPAVGVAPNGNLLIRITIDSETAQDALRGGVSIVVEAARENGFSATVLGVHLITEEELDRRLAAGDPL